MAFSNRGETWRSTIFALGPQSQCALAAARGPALDLKCEIKFLCNPSFPFQKTVFPNEETNVRLDSFFVKWRSEMECSILRIATYHKGLEGCDGFQNIFMICMRLLAKGEQISQPPAAAAPTLSITHSPAHSGLSLQAAWASGAGQSPPGIFPTIHFNIAWLKAAMQFIDTSAKWPEQE